MATLSVQRSEKHHSSLPSDAGIYNVNGTTLYVSDGTVGTYATRPRPKSAATSAFKQDASNTCLGNKPPVHLSQLLSPFFSLHNLANTKA